MAVFAGGNHGFGYAYYNNPYETYYYDQQQTKTSASTVKAMREALEEAKKSGKSESADDSMGVFADVGPSAAATLREPLSITA